MNLQKRRIFSWEMLPVIFTLAWPTILEEIMRTAVQYIDTAMVGSLGTQATAAVGATTTVNWLVISTISAMGVGLLSYISQACGANEKEKARHAASQAVLLVLVVGIAFTVLTSVLSPVVPVWMQVEESLQPLATRYFFILYLPMLPRTAGILFGAVLRAAGDTKTPMRAGILINVINVVLNFLMIYPSRTVKLFAFSFQMFGFGWGVEGAAIASAVAMTVGGVWITVAVWKHPLVSPGKLSLKPDWAILRPCMKVAVPNLLQRFGTSLGYVTFASMINSLGEAATAAHTIANTVESAFYIPGYGMQAAIATLSGNALGARDNRKLKELTSTTIIVEVALMTVSGGLLYLLAPNMVALFSDSQEVILLGAAVLRLVSLSEPVYGASVIIEGIMQGVGRTMAPFVFNIIGMWGVRMVGTFLCTQLLGYGLVSAWLCMVIHNLLLFVLLLTHYIRGTWNPMNKKETPVL